MSSKVRLGVLCVAALLAACGGESGSGSETAAAVMKADPRAEPFIGHWSACVVTTIQGQPNATDASEKTDFWVTSAGGLKLGLTITSQQYDQSKDCSGLSVLVEGETGELTLLGEITRVNGLELEKFTRTSEVREYDYRADPKNPKVTVTHSSEVKGSAAIARGSETELYLGDDSVPDADGFPSAILPMPLLKQPT